MSDSTPYEYVVRWRRANWSPTTKSKSRKFDRKNAALRFLAKVRATGGKWDELSPTNGSLERRLVGRWEPCGEWDDRP